MKVFISHSSHDKWVAKQISRLLESDGHTTFLDEKDIKTGDPIDAAIQTHLKDSDHLIIVLSPASIGSHWVFIEVGGAKALGKRVVPILLHLGGNEVPAAISQLLARDINDFDKYLAEISPTGLRPAVEASRGGGKSQWKTAPSPQAAALKKGQKRAARKTQPFRVGDTVRIVQVERLTPADKAKFPVWVEDMNKFSGVETHVTKLIGDRFVILAADDGAWKWSPSWLSKVG